MKSLFAIFITAVMLFKPLWPIVNYVANYDYIATVLCENKDKPELQCNGQCYLMKQLAKEQQQDPANPFEEDRISLDKNELVFVEKMQFDLDIILENIDTTTIAYRFKISLNESFSLLDPPPKV